MPEGSHPRPKPRPHPPPAPPREPLRVCMSGATGRTAYTLVFELARGRVFGVDQPLVLSLLDIPDRQQSLDGLAMELSDGAFQLLKEVIVTTDLLVAFKDIDMAFLMSAKPSQRKDLFAENVVIFKDYGEALDAVAKKTVKVVVVGNPPNTNALICCLRAPSIPAENFTCLMRLDQNRAQADLAKHLHVANGDVSKVIVWGNHSATQFPDIEHALVVFQGKTMPVREAIKNDHWIKNQFIPRMQNRGEEVIKLSGFSSALATSAAVIDHVRDWWFGTKGDNCVSMGVCSKGEYGIPEGLVFGFPVRAQNGNWSIVPDLEVSYFARLRIDANVKELQLEADKAELVLKSFLGPVRLPGRRFPSDIAREEEKKMQQFKAIQQQREQEQLQQQREQEQLQQQREQEQLQENQQNPEDQSEQQTEQLEQQPEGDQLKKQPEGEQPLQQAPSEAEVADLLEQEVFDDLRYEELIAGRQQGEQTPGE